jgi:exosortase B
MTTRGATASASDGAGAAAPRAWRPAGADTVSVLWVVAGLVLLYAPTFWDWSRGLWGAETQGHELLILALSAWLVFDKRHRLAALASAPAPLAGHGLLLLGLLMYFFGRTQEAVRVELLSLDVVVAGVLLRFKGWPALRLVWFALVFLLFAMPLPFAVSQALTAPMKSAVSAVAAQFLHWLGYPIGRSGVVITIGQYQLLVTEACAGLQTMFTLEAMGLLYANLMNHASAVRNALLAVLVVPISFCANVVRVVVLALVTHYLGDAAGQGFLHGFAGMVLFGVALALTMSVDRLLGTLLGRRGAAR